MNNGRRYSPEVKKEAKLLRRSGFTHREIARKLGTSWSIVCLWTKGIILTNKQKKAVQQRRYRFTFTKAVRQILSQSAKINLAPFWKKPYSKEELLDKIRRFHSEHERIPLKREFNMYEEYRQRFGSWNNAIESAGFKPNQVIFSKRFIANDNHICDSFAEKIIDDWLSKNNVKHERNIPYPNKKMTADFAVGNTRIEYFGLQGLNMNYDQNIKIKQKLCQKEGLKLIEIYPSDLFSKDFRNCLGGILKKLKE